MDSAPRLVAELMPISVIVAGEDAAATARAIEAAGAAAEALTAAPAAEPGYDLAILTAPLDSIGASATEARVRALAALSERLLFVPAAAAPGTAAPEAPGMDTHIAWFTLFAELGYQPVVEFDASFVRPGAFLLDRSATAAETELGAFAERLSLGGALAASEARVGELETALADAMAARALRESLAAREAELEVLRARTEAAEALAAEARADAHAAAMQQAAAAAAWAAMAEWVRGACGRPALDSPAAVREGLAAYGIAAPPAPRRLWWQRLLGRAAVPDEAEALRHQAAMIRACPLFDAAWYVAANPELALAAGAPDPVLHYLLRGAASGRDPGPWFDAAAYAARWGDVGEANPLVHAIAHGRVEKPPTP